MNINDYYIYVYLDPRKAGLHIYNNLQFDHEPFYIGIGHKYRINSHLQKVKNHFDDKTYLSKGNFRKNFQIRNILKESIEPIRFKLFENLFVSDAKMLERKYIQAIGRCDLKTGPLTNMTDGGEGLFNPSPETREKLRLTWLGKKRSKEDIQKMKDNGYWYYGDDHWIRDPKHTESRQKFINGGKSTQFKPGIIPKLKGKTYEELYGERSEEIKRKIGSRSYEGQEGSGNPSARGKKRRLIDSKGNEYLIHGNFVKFCLEHKLNKRKMLQVVLGNLPEHKGWTGYKIEEEGNNEKS